jgi:hypothetical protein
MSQSSTLFIGMDVHKDTIAVAYVAQEHAFYCGIDLHARSMSVCVVSQEGDILLHR